MRPLRTVLPACGLGACLLVPAPAGAGQDGADSAPSDVIRTELTLNLRPVAVSFEPGLGAGDPAHRELLAGSGSASGAPVRVGEIEVMPRLRIGTLDGTAPGGSESPNSATATYALWLARSGADWSLELRPPADGDETGEAGEADAEGDADEADAEGDAGEAGAEGDAGAGVRHDEDGREHGEAEPEQRETEAGDDEAGAVRDGGVIGSIPLTREAAGTRETFSAALVPTADDAGRLLLRWHDHRWAADFHFTDPPAPDEEDAGDSEADGEETEALEPEEGGGRPDEGGVESAANEPGRGAESERDEPEGDEPEGDEPGGDAGSDEDDGPRVANDRESLEFDSDTSAGSRLLRLSERHETAVELPPGARVSVLVWQEQSVEHADFAALAALAEGEVVRLTEAAVLRLRSEAALRFGDVTVPTGNLSPGFPGSYGLWLKRGAGGWRLVFNHEADSWGTQHDPAFDAAEIDVAHSEDGLATRPLGAALLPVTARSGRLVIHWGAHDWAADFTVPE